MRTYTLYLKSHTEAPDIEEEIQAENIIEAVEKLCKERSPYYCDYDADTLFRNMGCEEKEPKPFADKLIDELLKESDKLRDWWLRESCAKDRKDKLLLKLQRFIAKKGLFEDLIDFIPDKEDNVETLKE